MEISYFTRVSRRLWRDRSARDNLIDRLSRENHFADVRKISFFAAAVYSSPSFESAA